MQRDLPGALGRADESISHIEDSSTRMTVLVEDLLSLARLDEGRGIDITQQVPLTSLGTDATEDLHALDPGREIRRGTLTFQPRNGDEPAELEFVEGPLPDVTLKGDGARLRQVVTNIVGNIHRYTPADSPVEISVGVMPASISPESLARMSANDASMRYFIEAVDVSRSMQMGMNYAVVRFSDHGPGVPENSRSKIFERFYTADPSRARLKGGTGLGMAIAQSVVKAHKGFICATDSQGGGLPLHQAGADGGHSRLVQGKFALGPRAGGDEPRLLQHTAGLLHGVGVDPQLGGEHPSGGKPVSVPDGSGRDALL